jgi:transposase
VRWIGVDEKRFLNATAEHRTVYTTQIVDLDRHRLLDVVEGRSRDVLGSWLDEQGTAWCTQITLATLDPAACYRAALLDYLPNASRGWITSGSSRLDRRFELLTQRLRLYRDPDRARSTGCISMTCTPELCLSDDSATQAVDRRGARRYDAS